MRMVTPLNKGGNAFAIWLNDRLFIQSYETVIASWHRDTGLTRHWDGWSATSSRHLSLALADVPGAYAPNKANWLAMPVEHLSNVVAIRY